MIGPGVEIIGGISVLTKTILPILDKKVDLIYFSTVSKRELKESGKFTLQNIALALKQYIRFLYSMLRFRPHIIHIHTSQGIALLKDTFFVLSGKVFYSNVVLHVHAPNFDKLYCKQSPILQSYIRRVMKRADIVIALSSEWKKRIAQIIPNNQIFILRNCIDVNNIPPHIFSLEAKGLFLGSVGLRKGAFDLIEAIGRIKLKGISLKVWIVGYEAREGDLQRARSMQEELQLGDYVKILGTVYGEKKKNLLSKANFFVLPSYNEGLPMAILEAMAAGMAIISTSVGGIPEIVKDGYNGFIVNPGDVNALTEKLSILAGDLELLNIMGHRNREIAERELDVIQYVEKLVTLYDALLD